MRILVIGAYGLIGGYIVARLLSEGHQVVGAGRNLIQAKARMPDISWIGADLSRMAAADWRGHLYGVDAVVNCAGALQDAPGVDLRAVHVSGPLAVAYACLEVGVRRFVQISAAGIEEGSDRFSQTKLEGDRAIAALDLDWIILRPALVLAPAAFGGSALLRGLAAFPGLIPAVHAQSVVQVVSVQDLCQAVATAVRPETPAGRVCDLASEEITTLADILVALRSWLGLPRAPVVSVPGFLARTTGAFADTLSWLGWRSPMRSTATAQLAKGVRAKPEGIVGLISRPAEPLRRFLQQNPSTVQDRHFSRLYFIKPAALACLSIFWLVSGIVGLARHQAAAEILLRPGWSTGASVAVVVAGSLADMVIGLAIAFRRSARWGLLGALAVTGAYLVGASIVRRDLWANPLGPLVKTLPAAVLALAALAMMDDR